MHHPIEDDAESELSASKMKALHARIDEIDENAGERIKDLGDKVGCAVAICAVALGFVIIFKRSGNVGFVAGVLVLCVGLFASYIITTILHGYGESVTKSIIETKIKMRLEAKRAAELMEQLQAEQLAKKADIQEADVPPEVITETAVYDTADIGRDSEPGGPEPKGKAAPLLGKVDPKMRHVAHFAERCHHGIICPICGRLQDSNRGRCFSCRSNFIFDDEDATAAFTDDDDDDDIPEFTL